MLEFNLAKTIFGSDEIRFCEGDAESEGDKYELLNAVKIYTALEFYLVGDSVEKFSSTFKRQLFRNNDRALYKKV